ncbi:MAG: hypothetical protein FJ034_02445 [Chloroflexi bacterium]|nr:hypothetical protein [Chloroflexota bacterium]
MRRRVRVALFVLLFVLGLLPQTGVPASAALRYDGPILGADSLRTMPALSDGALSRVAGATLFTSSPVEAEREFDHLGVRWAAEGDENAVVLEARVSRDGAAWGAWMAVRPDEDTENPYTGERSSGVIDAGHARFAQYRAFFVGIGPEALRSAQLTFIDSRGLEQNPVERFGRDLLGAVRDWTRSYAQAATAMRQIRTRQDWGADETLMKWLPKYQNFQKAVVHHTVTSDGGTNVPATIRSIYYYHAVTLGWGDIGYSYLVDKNGVIWSGRQGGDNTIAGHAYGWNEGSIGIAAIGEFTSTQPSAAMLNAIAGLIGLKFAQYGMQPFGSGTFVHRERQADGSWLPVISAEANVLGHRDCNYVAGQRGGQTACPGGALYANLTGIRTQAQRNLEGGYDRLVRFEPQMPRAGAPLSILPVNTTIVNRGLQPILAGTLVSYAILQAGSVRVAQGSTAKLEQAVAPGASSVVTVPLVVPASGTYVVRWDLQSNGVWWSSQYGTPYREMLLRATDWSADWLSDDIPATFIAGVTRTVRASVLNDGGRDWPSTGTNPVRLSSTWKHLASGTVTTGARTPLPGDVKTGVPVQVSVSVTAPSLPGDYVLTLDLEKENEFRFGDRGVVPDDTSIAVLPDYKATYQTSGTPAFAPGQVASVPVTLRNTGTGTFPASAIALAYHWADGSGNTVVWEGQRTRLGADLAAGQRVSLNAQVLAPAFGGTYTLKLDLVHEGVAWFSAKGVPTADIRVSLQGQAPPPPTPTPAPTPVPPAQRTYGATYAPAPSALAVVGALGTVALTVTNTGNFTWPAAGANPVALSYHWIDSAGQAAVWDGARTKLAGDVAPGASAPLQANIKFPAAGGTYTLRWDLVEEGVTWFSAKGVPTRDQSVSVSATPTYAGVYDLSLVPTTLDASARATVPVVLYNGSNFAWNAGNGVNLSYHWYDAAGATVVWEGVRTPLNIPPGTAARVDASVVAPPPGAYTLRFDVVQEGVTWLSGAGVTTPSKAVSVSVQEYGATYAPAGTLSLRAGQTGVLPVTIRNTGSLIWNPAQGFALAYHVYRADGSVLTWDGPRTALPGPVAPGATISVFATFTAPAAPGAYVVKLDLVREGVTWFSGQGVPPAEVAATIN